MSAGKSKKEEPVYLTDEQIAELEKQHQQPEYLSDEQMAELEKQSQPKEDYLGQLGKAFTEALPTAGAAIGGTAGFLSPIPGGTLIGSGGGAALGKSIQNVIEQYAYDKPKTTANVLLDPVKEAAMAVAGEGVGAAVPVVAKYAGKQLKGLASSFSGIPEKAIETYAKRGDDVLKIDPSDLQGAADDFRTGVQKQVESFKSVQNAKITRAIDNRGEEMVNLSPAFEAIEENIAKLDPDLDAEKISKLAEKLDLLKKVSNEAGEMPAKKAYAAQKMLQDLADYQPPGGFKRRDFVDLTFARAAAQARGELKKVVPEIAQANSKMQQIRRLEKTMNKNMITPEKSYSALISAGSGSNQGNIAQLRKLEGVLGKDLLPQAENLAAASHFGNAKYLPDFNTGAKAVPLVTAGMALNQFGQGNVKEGLGIAATSLLGSPAAIKTGIDASRWASQLAPVGAFDLAKQMMSRAAQEGMHPFFIDANIKKASELTPTEKAKLRNENAKAAQ